MRILLLVALVACSSKAPAKPAPADFARMPEPDRCTVTEPRAAPCTDAMILADLESLGSDDGKSELYKTVEDDLRANPSTGEQRVKFHRSLCKNPNHPAAIMTCWDEPTCQAFARCVKTTTSKLDRP